MKQKKDSQVQDKPLYYSEEFWKKPNDQILKEAEEYQMKARAYEMEYLKKQKENKKQQ